MTDKPTIPLSLALHIPLSRAYLCIDCSCVGNRPTQCACCKSESLMTLANVLNREPAPAERLRIYEVERGQASK